MTALAFTVPGPPVSYARTRRCANTGRDFIAPKQRAYRKHIAACLRAAMLKRRQREPMLGALTLRLHVHTADYNRCGDASNYAKIIEDVMNASAYADDVQIVALHVQRFTTPDAPRVEVFVGQLDESEDVRVPQSKRRAP